MKATQPPKPWNSNHSLVTRSGIKNNTNKLMSSRTIASQTKHCRYDKLWGAHARILLLLQVCGATQGLGSQVCNSYESALVFCIRSKETEVRKFSSRPWSRRDLISRKRSAIKAACSIITASTIRWIFCYDCAKYEWDPYQACFTHLTLWCLLPSRGFRRLKVKDRCI